MRRLICAFTSLTAILLLAPVSKAQVQHIFGVDSSGGITHRVLTNFNPMTGTGTDLFPEGWRDMGVVGFPATAGTPSCVATGGTGISLNWGGLKLPQAEEIDALLPDGINPINPLPNSGFLGAPVAVLASDGIHSIYFETQADPNDISVEPPNTLIQDTCAGGTGLV
jgi:hypothetical protein